MQPLKKTKLVILQGEMVEWSITTVLKTVVPRGTGGSNPSLSASEASKSQPIYSLLFCMPHGSISPKSELESQLNPNDFFRVNRQYIVSASAVSGLKFSIAQLGCNVKCRLAIQSILN